MNDMTVALKKAGVDVPSQTKVLWLLAKDRPDKTAKELSALSGIPCSGVSSLLTAMVKRGMMIAAVDYARHRPVHTYRVLGKEYVMLPLPKTKPLAAGRAVDTAPEVQKPANKIDLESMTLAELRALHMKLCKLFKELT